MLGEELDVAPAVFQGITDTILDEIFGKVHIVVDVEECHFRLYHPELGEVARSIGVFGAECRAEGVDTPQSGGTELTFELT